MYDLTHVCEGVRELCVEVGKFIRQEASIFDSQNIEYKGVNDLVSYVDKTAEKMLVDGLQKLLPNAGFLAEEGTGSLASDLNWIVDPLDGTTNFIHGLPVFAISIALQNRDQLEVGVVYEINRQECFYATLGGGAFCNGEPITVSSVNKLSQGLIATGFPYYQFHKMNSYLSILQELMQNSHGLRRMGSAAVDLAYVACGRFEGFFEYNLNAWDVAAGALIVQEAGGSVTNFTGGVEFIDQREIVAGNAVHKDLIDVITKHWVDD